MPHPAARTWTLGTLDPAREYVLWLEPTTNRWEVALLEDPLLTALVTRATGRQAGRAERSASPPARHAGRHEARTRTA